MQAAAATAKEDLERDATCSIQETSSSRGVKGELLLLKVRPSLFQVETFKSLPVCRAVRRQRRRRPRPNRRIFTASHVNEQHQEVRSRLMNKTRKWATRRLVTTHATLLRLPATPGHCYIYNAGLQRANKPARVATD